MNKEPRYDKHSKTISLVWNFSPYQFPGLKYSDLQIKFRATREAWLQAWETLDFDTLTFADVKPFLSRNRKQDVEALAELAAEDPDHFSHSFLNCVIATKARDGVAWLKRNKISRLAMKLNHCLKIMRKANRSEWPTYFRNFHKIYFAKTITPFKSTEFPFVIAQALSDHFTRPFGENSFETFVKKRGLSLKGLERRLCLIPLADPDLSEFFAKFQK